MSHELRLQFDKLPTTFSQARRGLFSRTTDARNPVLPNIDAAIYDFKPVKRNVGAYARICGFGKTDGELPFIYPHMIAFKLHMELMLHHSFPLAVMGMVHIKNEITQYRAIKEDESLDVRAFFLESVRTNKGLEVVIKAEVRVGMELVWEDVTTYFARLPSKNKKKESVKRERPALPEHTDTETWSLPENLGFNYGMISGDPNPIHMHPITAKIFGFKRHIAHGMWTKARVAADLYAKLGSDKATMSIEFKQPIFLPGKVNFNFTQLEENGFDFDVRDKKGEKVHVVGKISAL